MSNTRKPKKRQKASYSLDRYRSEAKGEPFVLEVDEDRKIVIERPSGDVMMDVEEARTSREILMLLCGDKADEFLEVVGPEDFEVMQSISEDMQEHFGMGESRG